MLQRRIGNLPPTTTVTYYKSMIYNYLSLYFGAFLWAKLEKKHLQRKKRKKVVFLSQAEIADSTKSIIGIVAASRQPASRHCEASFRENGKRRSNPGREFSVWIASFLAMTQSDAYFAAGRFI